MRARPRISYLSPGQVGHPSGNSRAGIVPRISTPRVRALMHATRSGRARSELLWHQQSPRPRHKRRLRARCTRCGGRGPCRFATRVNFSNIMYIKLQQHIGTDGGHIRQDLNSLYVKTTVASSGIPQRGSGYCEYSASSTIGVP